MHPVDREGCVGVAGINKDYSVSRVADIAHRMGANILTRKGAGKWYIKQCPPDDIAIEIKRWMDSFNGQKYETGRINSEIMGKPYSQHNVWILEY